MRTNMVDAMQLIITDAKRRINTFPLTTSRQFFEHCIAIHSRRPLDNSFQQDVWRFVIEIIEILKLEFSEGGVSDDPCNYFECFETAMLDASSRQIELPTKYQIYIHLIHLYTFKMKEAFVDQLMPEGVIFLIGVSNIQIIAYLLYLTEERYFPLERIINTNIIQKLVNLYQNYRVDDDSDPLLTFVQLVLRLNEIDERHSLESISRFIQAYLLSDEAQETERNIIVPAAMLTLSPDNIMNIRQYYPNLFATLLLENQAANFPVDDLFHKVIALVGKQIKLDDPMYISAFNNPKFFSALSNARCPLSQFEPIGKSFFYLQWLLNKNDQSISDFMKYVSKSYLTQMLSLKNVLGTNILSLVFSKDVSLFMKLYSQIENSDWFGLIESKNIDHICSFDLLVADCAKLNYSTTSATVYLYCLIKNEEYVQIEVFSRVDKPELYYYLFTAMLYLYLRNQRIPPLSELTSKNRTPMHYIARNATLLRYIFTFFPRASYEPAFALRDDYGKTPLDYAEEHVETKACMHEKYRSISSPPFFERVEPIKSIEFLSHKAGFFKMTKPFISLANLNTGPKL